MPHPRLSVCMITLDAAAHLRECLASVAWADEIIVLDGGSTDATAQICAEFGAQLSVERDWRGFGVQKNRALARCSGDWVLSLDADEICTLQLRDEIQRVLALPEFAAYEMPRLSSFCGHWMRHGGWWPDRVLRLFRRGSARFSDDTVHERLLADGAVGRLEAHLLHYTYDNFEQALDKLNRYSTLGAQQAFERGQRCGPLTAVARGLWAFVRTYLLRLGLLDGWAGYQLALYNARGTYTKYLKLWLLVRRSGSG